jgi:hypothetical protein
LVVEDINGLVQLTMAQLQKPQADMMPYVAALVEDKTHCGWVLDLNQLIKHHHIKLDYGVEHG